MNQSALPPIEYAGRADRVRASCAAVGLDSLLVTNMVNVRWLTGFTGSSAIVALLPDRIVLVTDGRYSDRAACELADAGVTADIEVGFTASDQQKALLSSFAGARSVGVDAGHVSHARWTSLASDLPIIAADGMIENHRRTKDRGELARISQACQITDQALCEVVQILVSKPTEADVRNELEYRMRQLGADGPSYDTIVASGPQHAARPHHQVANRVITEGDTVVIDVGALVDGYHSDMTRSFVIGQPNQQQLDIYELLLEVQEAGIRAVRAGVAARDVDAVCRQMVADAGYCDWFLHSTGHGVGLLIHEDPFESPGSTLELRTGDVVTVEPGLYRGGFGGFRIEDLVEVTDSGCRILTASPKDSPCLPSQQMT